MTLSIGSVHYPVPGCIAEILMNDQPLTVWVVEQISSSQLRLLTATKREFKLATARLLPWLGPQCKTGVSRQDIQNELNIRQDKRERLAVAISPLEIWNLIQNEVDKATPKWFAELLWECPDFDHVAAVGRALLACKTHFRLHFSAEFEVLSAKMVETRLAAYQIAQNHKCLTTIGRSFFQKLWAIASGNKIYDIPLIVSSYESSLVRQLEFLLRRRLNDPVDKSTQAMWNIVRKGLPEHSYQALILAQTWGLVPWHYNQFLDQIGYASGDAWSMAFSSEITAQQIEFKSRCQSAEICDLVSVDNVATRDIDDAFSIAQQDNNNFCVRIALACPALVWKLDTPLDMAVAQRGTSLYFPEGNSHMLPEVLGTELFSLQSRKDRPALLLTINVDSAGNLIGCSLKLMWIQVAANLSYSEVEMALVDDISSPAICFIDSLRIGLALARKLRARRIARGAVVIERSEPKIVLYGLEDYGGRDVVVSLESDSITPNAQLLVSELMILANQAVAIWASQAGKTDKISSGYPILPLIHRTHFTFFTPEHVGVWSQPLDIFRVVKTIGSSHLEVMPRPHRGLGVPLYTPISSPLRRYADLLNLVQILYFLEYGKPYWAREVLESKLALLNVRLDLVNRAQHSRIRYWKLLYCKQQAAKRRFTGVLVDMHHRFVTLVLTAEQLFVRGQRQLFGDKPILGAIYSLKFSNVDPLNNEIHIIEAKLVDSYVR